MIQRLQTVYLFLAVIGSAIMIMGGYISYTALPLAITSVLTMLLAVTGIFLYKKRKLQRRVVQIAIVADIVSIILVALNIYTGLRGEENLFALNFRVVIPPVILIFLFLALHGIKRDEDLIRSYDRLR